LALVATALPAAAGADARRSVTVIAPPAHARFDYQIGGAYPPATGVSIVDRDRTARPAVGLYNICYVNAYQTQPGETAWWKAHRSDLLLRRRARYVRDPAYPDELLLDTSSASKRHRIGQIVGRWIDGCAAAGFSAVEPDNLDSWTRSHGRLTRHDNLALASLLIRRAHARGLAIAQKNTGELGSAGRRIGFDFAVAEECGAYHECGSYTAAFGARVIEIEYPDNGGRANYLAACRDRGGSISITYRDRAVAPKGRPGYTDEAC